eukprot:EG_transcript_23809
MVALAPLEQEREALIARNQQFLQSLGLDAARPLARPRRPAARAKPRRPPATVDAEPPRKSPRLGGAGATPASPALLGPRPGPQPEGDAELVARGLKVKVGSCFKWVGERFGAVPGVAVGAVFGAGDYQRRGRQEMAAAGFFVPFVQPEWLEPNGGCYALILNNDNGSSTDRGHSFVYVGGGGRHRGQNRTARQTFHQTWDNLTNAALRRNCGRHLPVRVVRGPKLASPFRPGGGGFRYDGLYTCTRAEMVKNEDGHAYPSQRLSSLCTA